MKLWPSSHEAWTAIGQRRLELTAKLAAMASASLCGGFESSTLRSSLRPIFTFFLGFSIILCALQLTTQSPGVGTRQVIVDIKDSAGPLDGLFDLSVGSDSPGTLIHDDSQAQLKLVVDEFGFRYICFHTVFHDVFGTVRIEDGKAVYNLLGRHIRSFVDLGLSIPMNCNDTVLVKPKRSQEDN